MKIAKIRRILDKYAALQVEAGNAEAATLLNDLSSVLKPADKDEVSEFVSRMDALRRSRSNSS